MQKDRVSLIRLKQNSISNNKKSTDKEETANKQFSIKFENCFFLTFNKISDII